MRADVRQALEVDSSSGARERTIDITTTGRRSGQPRRIETWFYRFEDAVYLSGVPGRRTRRWLLNLEAEPRLTFHLKGAVIADLPASAEVITDPAERERVLRSFHAEFSARGSGDGPGAGTTLADWVDGSPLARVRFDDP